MPFVGTAYIRELDRKTLIAQVETDKPGFLAECFDSLRDKVIEEVQWLSVDKKYIVEVEIDRR